MNSDTTIIEAEGLSKGYSAGGARFLAVRDASFRVEKGDFSVIVGHSGSGKTTLLNLLGGLTRPESGTVLVGKKDLWAMKDKNRSDLRNREMNFVFQFASLMPTLNARENVLLPLALNPSRRQDMRQGRGRAEELLDLVGLAAKAGAYPAELSGGQQRRVAIARAFMNDPQVVFADEPTGDLDQATEAEIVAFFRRINTERGTAFVIVTHSAAIADGASRVFTMNEGQLLSPA